MGLRSGDALVVVPVTPDADPGHIEITYERDSDGQWSGEESKSPRRSR
jgi:hypothetical protein